MLNKDTQLCMSLSGRPGNFGTTFHNYLYQKSFFLLKFQLFIKSLQMKVFIV